MSWMSLTNSKAVSTNFFSHFKRYMNRESFWKKEKKKKKVIVTECIKQLEKLSTILTPQ